MTRWGGALVLAMLCGTAQAAAPCSAEEMVNARVAASDARDWETLYPIGRLLASRWGELHELEYYAESNRAFRAFVVEHIDVTDQRDRPAPHPGTGGQLSGLRPADLPRDRKPLALCAALEEGCARR